MTINGTFAESFKGNEGEPVREVVVVAMEGLNANRINDWIWNLLRYAPNEGPIEFQRKICIYFHHLIICEINVS